MKDEWVYRQHILDSIQAIMSYLGPDFASFTADRMRVDAVVRNLEIIGEAARQAGEALWRRYPEAPWPDIIGMRNHLIHEYFGVDIQAVWTTCQEDLPMLEKVLGKPFQGHDKG